jgi:hypothetical protein
MFDVPQACSGIEAHLGDRFVRPPAFYGMIMDRSTVARRLGVFCLSVSLRCVEAQAATPAQGWRIDEAQTSIGFTIDAVGFPTTHGHFAHYRGRLLIDFDRPAKSYRPSRSMRLPSTSALRRSTISSRARFCSMSSDSRP